MVTIVCSPPPPRSSRSISSIVRSEEWICHQFFWRWYNWTRQRSAQLRNVLAFSTIFRKCAVYPIRWQNAEKKNIYLFFPHHHHLLLRFSTSPFDSLFSPERTHLPYAWCAQWYGFVYFSFFFFSAAHIIAIVFYFHSVSVANGDASLHSQYHDMASTTTTTTTTTGVRSQIAGPVNVYIKLPFRSSVNHSCHHAYK